MQKNGLGEGAGGIVCYDEMYSHGLINSHTCI